MNMRNKVDPEKQDTPSSSDTHRDPQDYKMLLGCIPLLSCPRKTIGLPRLRTYRSGQLPDR
jgi:hypothetical protein